MLVLHVSSGDQCLVKVVRFSSGVWVIREFQVREEEGQGCLVIKRNRDT